MDDCLKCGYPGGQRITHACLNMNKTATFTNDESRVWAENKIIADLKAEIEALKKKVLDKQDIKYLIELLYQKEQAIKKFNLEGEGVWKPIREKLQYILKELEGR